MIRIKRFCEIKQIKTVLVSVIFSLFFIPCFADNAVTGSGTECVYGTLNTYTGPSTIKANWDPNTINLYWYNDEQKLTVQTAANTCNYDSGISLPSSNPTKTGYTFTGWEVLGGVPTGYTMLEYIQFSGTQYINTNFTPNQDTEVQAKFMVTTTSSCWVYGSGSANPRITTYYSANGGSGNQRFGNSTIARSIPTNQVIDIIQNKSGNTLNGAFIAYPTVSNFTSSGVFLIGKASASSSTSGLIGRLYHIKIYDAGALRFNFIPAKDSSNVIGLYDTVSGSFFTNTGSGTFTAGPAIQ